MYFFTLKFNFFLKRRETVNEEEDEEDE